MADFAGAGGWPGGSKDLFDMAFCSVFFLRERSERVCVSPIPVSSAGGRPAQSKAAQLGGGGVNAASSQSHVLSTNKTTLLCCCCCYCGNGGAAAMSSCLPPEVEANSGLRTVAAALEVRTSSATEES